MSSQAQPHHLALDAQALREAVEAHQRYLAGRSGGRRLSLTYADLSNCTLEGLDLRNTKLTDKGLAHLESLEKLRAVFVGTVVSDRAIIQMKTALPECKIVR